MMFEFIFVTNFHVKHFLIGNMSSDRNYMLQFSDLIISLFHHNMTDKKKILNKKCPTKTINFAFILNKIQIFKQKHLPDIQACLFQFFLLLLHTITQCHVLLTILIIKWYLECQITIFTHKKWTLINNHQLNCRKKQFFQQNLTNQT